jgi:hypothetical protein
MKSYLELGMPPRRYTSITSYKIFYKIVLLRAIIIVLFCKKKKVFLTLSKGDIDCQK